MRAARSSSNTASRRTAAIRRKQAEATYLQIAGQSRFNFKLGWENQSLLTEAERGVIQSSRARPSPPIPTRRSTAA